MKGTFTVSLDFELIWGTLDSPRWTRFAGLCQREREQVIDRLLALLARYEIPATWATVGHLMLDRCDGHPERRAWFARDPGSNEETAPIFYGASLMKKIMACPVPQEIGCHTFSHVIFGDTGCSTVTARTEVDACLAAARSLGVELKSFVFPRNRIGHLDIVAEKGFLCYRGHGSWYEREGTGRLTRRAAHLWDILTCKKPPAVEAEPCESGMWNIPGSMLYTPSHGIRRWLPVSWRVARARKGLAEAAASGRIFHLWFHPTDVVERCDDMFDGLERIFQFAAKLRDAGLIEIEPMGRIAARAEQRLRAEIEAAVPSGLVRDRG